MIQPMLSIRRTARPYYARNLSVRASALSDTWTQIDDQKQQYFRYGIPDEIRALYSNWGTLETFFGKQSRSLNVQHCVALIQCCRRSGRMPMAVQPHEHPTAKRRVKQSDLAVVPSKTLASVLFVITMVRQCLNHTEPSNDGRYTP